MGAACCYDVLGDGVPNAVHKRKSGSTKKNRHHNNHDDDDDDDDSDDDDDDEDDMHVVKDLVRGQVPGKLH